MAICTYPKAQDVLISHHTKDTAVSYTCIHVQYQNVTDERHCCQTTPKTLPYHRIYACIHVHYQNVTDERHSHIRRQRRQCHIAIYTYAYMHAIDAWSMKDRWKTQPYHTTENTLPLTWDDTQDTAIPPSSLSSDVSATDVSLMRVW